MTTSTSQGKSVSKDQKMLLVNLMEENIDSANDRFVGMDGKGNNKAHWNKVATQLNSLGGANKDGEKWRRAWIDMKKYVRAQWTSLKEHDNRTGLGLVATSKRPSPLNALDERILNIITTEACEGSNNVEGGFELSTQQLNTSDLGQSADNLIPETNVAEVSEMNGSMAKKTTRQIRTKRIRGSAYTRDKLLEEANKIESQKVIALNRIAAANEVKAVALNRQADALEEKNKILKLLLQSFNISARSSNHDVRLSSMFICWIVNQCHRPWKGTQMQSPIHF